MNALLLALILSAPPAPRDAVAAAIAHSISVGKNHPEKQQLYQYFWVQTPEDLVALNLSLNATSRSSFIKRVQVLPNGTAVAYLPDYYPEEADLVQVLDLLDGIVDPYFQVIRSTSHKVTVPKYKAKDGNWYDYKFEKQSEVSFGLHVVGHDRRAWIKPALPSPDAADYVVSDINLLADLTHRQTPILTARFYIARKALVTLDGGLYYDLLGWRGKNLDQILTSAGASEQRVKDAKAIERAAMLYSGVTGFKPRAVTFFYGTNVRASQGLPFITITEDIIDGDFDPNKSAIYNLLGGKFDAREGFIVLPNGMQAAFLTNGAGALVDSAPDTVARDFTVPSPHTNRLQPYISCFRCHGPDSGYKPFPNHVKTLLAASAVFDDEGALPKTAGVVGEDELRDTLKSLYSGDINRALERARIDYAASIYEATGLPLEKAVPQVVTTFNAHEYSLVTTRDACFDLGFEVKSEQESLVLFKALTTPLVVSSGGFAPQSATVVALRAGLHVPRREWEHVYADVALQSLSYEPK